LFELDAHELSPIATAISEAGEGMDAWPSIQAEIATLVDQKASDIEVSEAAERYREGILEEIAHWREEVIPGLETEADREILDMLHQFASGERQFVTDEVIDIHIRDMDRLINREFAGANVAAGTALAGRGTAGGSFAAQLGQQMRTRALDARIGGRERLRAYQDETNAAVQAQFVSLYNQTRDANKARVLQAESFATGLEQMLAGLEMTGIAPGMDFTLLSLLSSSFREMLVASDESSGDWLQNTLTMITDGAQQLLAYTLPRVFGMTG
jgi:hypothetical protein